MSEPTDITAPGIKNVTSLSYIHPTDAIACPTIRIDWLLGCSPTLPRKAYAETCSCTLHWKLALGCF